MAGNQDKKERKVDDYYSALLWILLFITGTMYPYMYFVAIGVFALTFFTNVLYYRNRNEQLLGLGDVFILPVFIAFILIMVNQALGFFLIIVSLLAPYIEYLFKGCFIDKKCITWEFLYIPKFDYPMVYYMFLAYLAAFILCLASPIS